MVEVFANKHFKIFIPYQSMHVESYRHGYCNLQYHEQRFSYAHPGGSQRNSSLGKHGTVMYTQNLSQIGQHCAKTQQTIRQI